MMAARLFWAVIPAAGMGIRMKSGMPKQYLGIQGIAILEHTLKIFCTNDQIRGVVVALAENDANWVNLGIHDNKKIITTIGGRERSQSVLNGLEALKDLAGHDDWVLVHDAARPCLRPEDLEKLMETLAEHPTGGILGVPVGDTMKRAGRDREIIETVDREDLWHALTPQMFRYGLLKSALEHAIAENIQVRDEAQAVELLGVKPALVEGHSDNIKITYQSDLTLAQFILSQQEQ